MSEFRTITSDGEKYLWKYNYDEDDCQLDSFLVVRSEDKKGKLIIYFSTGKWDWGYCPFNKGVPAVYQNEPVIINLNQPWFTAQIISFVINQMQVRISPGTAELYNGIEILHKIGYEFDYRKAFEG